MKSRSNRRLRTRAFQRVLRLEGLEQRLLMAGDLDDSLSEAISLGSITSTGKTTSETISPDTDVDMYRFAVVAGQVVDFNIDTPVNGPGGLDSYLRLFDSEGNELAANDDGAAPGENSIVFDSYLRVAFSFSGTYYVGISNANNSQYDPLTGDGDTSGGPNATGTYQLILQALPADTDDSRAEAVSLGAISTTPQVVDASISTDIDVDMYRFTVTTGQVVDFDIDTVQNGPGGLGSYLRLFDSGGNELAFNNDGMAPGEDSVGFDAYLRRTFPASGTFYLGISNFNNIQYDPTTGNGDTAGGQYSIGSYELIVQALPVDTDDSLAEAPSLGAITTTPNVIDATISTDIDVNMYRFTVSAGQVVDFDIDTDTNGPGGLGSYLRLFDSTGQQLAANNDAMAPGENAIGFDAYLRHTFASAGTFYIGVSNFNNIQYDPITGNGDTAGGPYSIGSYELIVQALPVDTDDSLAEAPSLGAVSTTPSIADDSISTDIDVDMYRFTVVSGQVVDFNINTPFNGPRGLGSYLRLFSAQGVELAFNNDAAAPGESQIGFDSYLRHTFAVGGTYYVGVSNANNTQYDPLTGNGDTAGGPYSIGTYQLIVEVFPPTLFVTSNLMSIPEINGSAIGTVARNSGDVSFLCS